MWPLWQFCCRFTPRTSEQQLCHTADVHPTRPNSDTRRRMLEWSMVAAKHVSAGCQCKLCATWTDKCCHAAACTYVDVLLGSQSILKLSIQHCAVILIAWHVEGVGSTPQRIRYTPSAWTRWTGSCMHMNSISSQECPSSLFLVNLTTFIDKEVQTQP